MDAFRVVVVDDSALFRTLLRNALQEIPGCEVVGTASDGPSALQKIVELNPDLVTLDIEMPLMDGISVLQELKKRRIRAKIVMVSRLTSAGAQVTTDALLQGAFDFILKPSGRNPAANKAELVAALREKIDSLRGTDESSSPPNPAISPKPASMRAPKTSYEAVVIGCSTGGPDALSHVLPFLQPDLPVPVLVVQHMPEGFTASLARRLDEACELEVVEASDGFKIRKGLVILARGGRHLRIVRRGPQQVEVELSDEPREHNCRPSVDFTLRSAIDAFAGRVLAVILTGMGRDGTEGCRLLREKGGEVLVQHAEGCVVFGMPKSVINAGQADKIVPLREIAAAIESAVRSGIAR